MKKKANNNLTSFVGHLDQQYGKRGTPEREKFEEGLKLSNSVLCFKNFAKKRD